MSYLLTACSVGGSRRISLMASLMMASIRDRNYFGPLPYRREVYQIDASYCLDAPEAMPAGGCHYLVIGDTIAMAEQLITLREDDPLHSLLHKRFA